MVGAQLRWRIGGNVNQVGARDVLLLGLVIVSDGAAMPILQVREDFGKPRPSNNISTLLITWNFLVFAA